MQHQHHLQLFVFFVVVLLLQDSIYLDHDFVYKQQMDHKISSQVQNHYNINFLNHQQVQLLILYLHVLQKIIQLIQIRLFLVVYHVVLMHHNFLLQIHLFDFLHLHLFVRVLILHLHLQLLNQDHNNLDIDHVSSVYFKKTIRIRVRIIIIILHCNQCFLLLLFICLFICLFVCFV